MPVIRWMCCIVFWGCGSVGSSSDAALIDDALADAAGIGAWTTAQLVSLSGWTTSINSPSMTADRLELYFVGDPSVTNDHLYVTKRASASDPWGAPALDAELSSSAIDRYPAVADDGLTLWLASNRTGTLGGLDIWVSTRASRSQPWTTPVNVAELNSTAEDAPGRITSDGLTMSFQSNRAGTAGGWDLYVASRTSISATWTQVRQLYELDTTANDERCWLSDGGLTSFFDSNRSGTYKIYTVSRTAASATFGAPATVGEFDSTAGESAIWLTPDLHHAVYTSARSGAIELYESSR